MPASKSVEVASRLACSPTEKVRCNDKQMKRENRPLVDGNVGVLVVARDVLGMEFERGKAQPGWAKLDQSNGTEISPDERAQMAERPLTCVSWEGRLSATWRIAIC